MYFGIPLKKFIDSMGEFSFKAGPSGLEASGKRQFEAAALLGAASASRITEGVEEKQLPKEEQARQIANVVSEASKPKTARRLEGANVLWVDDRPSNNTFERAAMEALGVRFTISTTTEDALEKLRQNRFDAIISDMGRPPDNRAGYTLLDEIRKQNIKTPYIIYAGSNAPEHRAEAQRRGALGSTNNPQELLQLVTSAILAG